MQELHFSIEIKAPKDRVWATLWEDASFREWANQIDEGMYMVGNLQEGNEIQFLSSVNGYGVTSLIEKWVPNAFVMFRHRADTMENGQRDRDNEWTGGREQYLLSEENNVTLLSVKTEVPPELVAYFQTQFPNALATIKTISEVTNENSY